MNRKLRLCLVQYPPQTPLKAKFSQFKFDLKPHFKNLGYIIDSHFKMDKQVN